MALTTGRLVFVAVIFNGDVTNGPGFTSRYTVEGGVDEDMSIAAPAAGNTVEPALNQATFIFTGRDRAAQMIVLS